MQASNAPSKSAVPFAQSGTKNTIPVASQIGVTPGAASFTDGFPPLTMTPLAAGGVPPYGADFNGILNFLSDAVRWSQVGGGYSHDAVFAGAVGGYPRGALLLKDSGAGYWLNTAENNSTNPDTGGAGWSALPAGISTVAQAQAMTDDATALTPLKLASVTATQSRRGIAAVASLAQAGAGVDDSTIMTPRKTVEAIARLSPHTFQTLAGSGSFVVPADTYFLDIEMWGGGGGGGGVGSAGTTGAGGGGAGEYVRFILPVAPGSSIAYAVGTGGSGGGGGAAGGNGGSTIFGAFSALGGAGGSPNGIGNGGAGGTGGAGAVSLRSSGNAGGAGATAYANGAVGGMGGGAAFGGAGGSNGPAASGNGGFPGGGGAGRGTSNVGPGGLGSAGLIIVRC